MRTPATQHPHGMRSRSGRYPARRGVEPNPSRACCASGSDTGFSPITYMPWMTSSWTASMISTTVRPFSGSRSASRTLELGADIRDFDGLIVREDHRNESAPDAPDVVLTAQRMHRFWPLTCPVIKARSIRQRALPCRACCEIPCPRKQWRCSTSHKSARRCAASASMPQPRHLPVRNLGSRSASNPSVRALTNCRRAALPRRSVQHRIQHGDIGPGLELQHMGRVFAQGLAARIADDQVGRSSPAA